MKLHSIRKNVLIYVANSNPNLCIKNHTFKSYVTKDVNTYFAEEFSELLPDRLSTSIIFDVDGEDKQLVREEYLVIHRKGVVAIIDVRDMDLFVNVEKD